MPGGKTIHNQRAEWARRPVRAGRCLGAFVGLALLASCAGTPEPRQSTAQAPLRDEQSRLTQASVARARALPERFEGAMASDPQTTPADKGFREVGEPQGFVRYAPADPVPLAIEDPSALPPLQPMGDGAVTLNFNNASLETVVHTILGEELGETYLVDAGLSGTVTLQSGRPVDRAQLLTTLQEILRMNGAALVRTDGLYKVVRGGRVGAGTPELTFAEAASRGLTVRVTPLLHTDVSAVREILESFAPASGRLSFDAGRNLVFSVATEAEQRSLRDLIGVLDVDYLSGLAFALEPLEEAQAEELASELEAIAARPTGARAGAQEGEEAGAALRFIPITRMNAILVVARTNRHLKEARLWIDRLDQGSADSRQLFVYAVKHRRASELAELIGKIFSVAVASQGVDPAGLAPGRTGVSLLGGAEGGEGAGAGGDQIRAGVGRPGEDQAPGGGGDGLKITADQATNALVIYATQDEYTPIRNAIERLDSLPTQVLIEATLAEVSLRNDLEFGVRWFFQSGSENAGGFSGLQSNGTNPIFPGFNYLLNTSDVRFALNALREVTDVEFLSSPNLLVLDNQPARLQVGDQVPIQTRAAVDVTNPGAPIVNDIDYRDTGVILSVTPRVTDDGVVVLDILQEVSEVVETNTSGIVSPTIQQRSFASTVAVHSGETVVLGGLTRNSTSVGRTGVPVLSDVPLIGNLFTTRSDRRDRTELLVLITPRVIRNETDSRAATSEMQRRLTDIFSTRPTQTERIIGPMDTTVRRSAPLDPLDYIDPQN